MESKFDTFGRDPAFEGGSTGSGHSVAPPVRWVPRVAHGALTAGSLAIKLFTVAIVACMLMDFFGVRQLIVLSLFLDLGRLMLEPLGHVFTATQTHLGHFDWSGLVAIAALTGGELVIRWGQKRLV